jgi:hypothetical protein
VPVTFIVVWLGRRAAKSCSKAYGPIGQEEDDAALRMISLTRMHRKLRRFPDTKPYARSEEPRVAGH